MIHNSICLNIQCDWHWFCHQYFVSACDGWENIEILAFLWRPFWKTRWPTSGINFYYFQWSSHIWKHAFRHQNHNSMLPRKQDICSDKTKKDQKMHSGGHFGICKLDAFPMPGTSGTFSMLLWRPYRNALWQKTFCCNFFQVDQ